MSKPTATFGGVRLEGLQALQRYVDIRQLLAQEANATSEGYWLKVVAVRV